MTVPPYRLVDASTIVSQWKRSKILSTFPSFSTLALGVEQ